MYELKRRKRINEQIKIGDEIITVDIDAESIALEYDKRYNAIVKAEQNLKKAQGDKSKVLQAYGEAVAALFDLIFGEENAEKIIKFYENRFIEMSMEVFPFIIDVIRPALTKAFDDMRTKATAQYKQKQGLKKILGR